MARLAVLTAAPILPKRRGAWPVVLRASECFLGCFSRGTAVYDCLHEPVSEADRPLEWGEHPPIHAESEDEDHRHHGEDTGNVVQLAARLEKLPEPALHVQQLGCEERTPGEGPAELRPRQERRQGGGQDRRRIEAKALRSERASGAQQERVDGAHPRLGG